MFTNEGSCSKISDIVLILGGSYCNIKRRKENCYKGGNIFFNTQYGKNKYKTNEKTSDSYIRYS